MVYLDHAATTPTIQEALSAMLPWYDPELSANPSSIHSAGKMARAAVEDARTKVAKLIGADVEEIFFTSGGTESNNTWLKMIPRPCYIVTNHAEHASVLSPIDAYSALIWYAELFGDGTVDPDSIREMPGNPDAVSVMWVNNELGSVNDIPEIAKICERRDIPLHVDAIQAVGHVPVNVRENPGITFLSMSAHKFGGPMGVGALYVRGGTQRWRNPLVRGGGQERGARGGTENLPGIVGMGAASEVAGSTLAQAQRLSLLFRREFYASLKKYMKRPYRINGQRDAPTGIISLTIPGINSESLLTALDAEGVCVSAGSACSAGGGVPSHVLTAIGMSAEDAASTIRVSCGHNTMAWELEYAAEKIANAMSLISATTANFDMEV